MKNLLRSLCLLIVFPSLFSAMATDFPLSGSGTADSPYLITSAADWNSLADYISTATDSLTGKYLQLTADLDFSDTTITPFKIFGGDLDGNGKTIKGLSITTSATNIGGLINSTVKITSTYLHDFTIEGEVVCGKGYFGGVACNFWGKMENIVNKLTITAASSVTTNYVGGFSYQSLLGATYENCTFEGSMTISGIYCAGIVASCGSETNFIKCANTADITYTGSSSSAYISGITGRITAGSVTECYNTGNITAAGGGLVSGLIGNSYGNTTDPIAITDCYNTGDITALHGAAGLVATYLGNKSYLVMTNCYNTGNVSSTSESTYSSQYTAGICAVYNPGSSFTNCWNSGTITSVGPQYTGGILGSYKATGTANFSAETPVTVTNCYNTGEIVAKGSIGGGIVGCMTIGVVIDSCYNTGNVSGGYQIGGIAGSLNDYTSSISNSWNSGNITSDKYYVGGIVGKNGSGGSVTNCFNTGDVSTTSTTTGTSTSSSDPAGFAIGGIAGLGSASFTNVYNTGSITGVDYTGGIVGQTLADSTQIVNAYTSGEVISTGSYYGNIVGVSLSDTDYWNSSNSMSSTYYLSANAVECTDTVSVGLSYAELAVLDLGDGWTAGDNYTYPRITTLADNDYAKAYAAAVIPTGDDTYSSITQNFDVGTPDGVTWTASPAYVTIDGNVVTFNESYEGTLIMTATCGDVSVDTELICYVSEVGISDIAQDGRTVISERFYTPSGAQVAEPTDGQKAIYIIVRTYDDGTQTTIKEIM